MTLAAGVRLGPYEIVAALGSGGMGEVYKARDTRLNRTVAIKILPAGLAADPQRQERFRREARAISSLTHPHICTLYDIGDQDAVDFLVMEYLPGETLAHRLLRGPLPLEEVFRLGVQLAGALDAAHRQRLTHRDLKPANVMLTAGAAKILDFGVAKWHGPEPDEAVASGLATVQPTLTQASAVVGTLQYMAPEQLEGKPADSRSDLFALGAVLYEMTTGRKAFDGASASSITAAILSGPTPSILTVQPTMPAALDRVVRKCLANDPFKRWQTASDLRDELEWIAQGAPTVATEPPARSASWSTRALWIGIVGTALASFAGLALFTIPRWYLVRPVPAPTTSFMVLPPDNASEVEQPTISPDGRTLAFTARTKGGRSSLWVRPLEALDAHRVADAGNTAFPFWSSDSQSVAFFSEGQLKRVDAAGGLTQVICSAPAGRGGTWSPDGTIVFAPSAETPLSRVAAGGGAPTPLTNLDASSGERSHRFPQFLTDHRRFIYTVYFKNANQKPALKVASLDAPGTTTTLTQTSFARSLVFPGYLLFKRDDTGPFLAQRFDEGLLRVRSEPVPVIDRVAPGPVGGTGGLSVSRNGVLAYQTVTADPTIQLTWFGRSGQKLGDVDQTAIGQDFADFSLSNDGTRVAAAHSDQQTHLRDVWVLDVSRGAASRVTVDGKADDPKWSPDDSRLAFTSNRRGTGNADIYVTRWNGDRSVEPLLISDANKYLLDWSRDGAFLLFSAQEGPKAIGNLWVLPLKGGGAPRRYLETQFPKGEARFSPDTRWVTYQSDESGRNEVYVQSFPEPGTRYQVSSEGGASPRWRRDGRELFYISPGGKMMAAAVRVTPAFNVSSMTALFSIPHASADLPINFEVAPDGKRLLIGDVVRGLVRSPITVVLNWTPPVKN